MTNDKTVLALVVLLAASGCGYSFKAVGLTAPEGVRTIAVTVLENRTSESGIETIFASDLAYEFTRSKVLRVVDKDTADAVLGGCIVFLNVDAISHTASYQSDERRVTLALDLVLKRTDGEVIWSVRALQDRECFKVSSDKLDTEANERAAIEAIFERMAEIVHYRILHGF